MLINVKNKYYIRINEKNRITKAFSEVFEEHQETDIFIGEGEGAQFRAREEVLSEELKQYADVENGLMLTNGFNILVLKYENGLICKVSDEEIYEEIERLPKPEPTEIDKLREENLMLMGALAEIYEMIV